jgi:hypothetical protein
MLAACATPTQDTPPRVSAAKAGPAAAGDPTINSVIPDSASQDTTLDVRVLGSNYDRGSVAELVLDGVPTPGVVTNSTRYKNSGELIANITIAPTALVANYDVLVTTSRGKKGIGIEKFEVNAKVSCPAEVFVTMTGLSGALAGDGANYAAKINGVNGNLYLDLRNTARRLVVTTSLGSGSRAARTFTNNHEATCGLAAMSPAGSAGSAVLEVEWSEPANRYTLRYGKNCVGEFGTVVPANKVTTNRNGNVWTLSGDAGEGILCQGRLNGKANWTPVGTAGAFSMTLTAP